MQCKGWAHWLGRVSVWIVGTVVGAIFGVLLGGLLQGGTMAWVMIGLWGISLIATAWAGSSLSFPVRDLLAGLGIGQLVGAGFAMKVLSALPSC